VRAGFSAILSALISTSMVFKLSRETISAFFVASSCPYSLEKGFDWPILAVMVRYLPRPLAYLATRFAWDRFTV
jgi:hypothetical protein